jgi:hypothetical protein
MIFCGKLEPPERKIEQKRFYEKDMFLIKGGFKYLEMAFAKLLMLLSRFFPVQVYLVIRGIVLLSYHK